MTLKKNGQWSLSRLALLATILGGIAMMVEAMPTAIHYIQTGISPWTKLPSDIADVKITMQAIPQMKSDIADIKSVIIKKPWEQIQRPDSLPSPRQTTASLVTNQAPVISQLE